jgi:hypothetical protein
MKRIARLMMFGAVGVGCWAALPAPAGDMEATLDTADGSSSFVVANSATGSLLKARSDGAVSAGPRASAAHAGSFVWADSAAAGFASSSSNQFLLRAGGGVGINTAAPQAALHVAGDAVVGSLTNAPRFGMQAVASGTSTVLFQHPAANVSLLWDASAYVLTVSNAMASTNSYDVHVIMSRDVDAGTDRTALGFARDLYGADMTLAVTNAVNQSAGYTITVVREEQRGPGFTFQGGSWDSSISGLVMFWY